MSEIQKQIDEIKRKLDNIEDMMAWSVRASQRFRVGQRVQFSSGADRKGISQRIRGRVRTGKIVGVGPLFEIVVMLDGYKHPKRYHHGFFDPAGPAPRKRKAVAKR